MINKPQRPVRPIVTLSPPVVTSNPIAINRPGYDQYYYGDSSSPSIPVLINNPSSTAQPVYINYPSSTSRPVINSISTIKPVSPVAVVSSTPAPIVVSSTPAPLIVSSTQAPGVYVSDAPVQPQYYVVGSFKPQQQQQQQPQEQANEIQDEDPKPPGSTLPFGIGNLPGISSIHNFFNNNNQLAGLFPWPNSPVAPAYDSPASDANNQDPNEFSVIRPLAVVPTKPAPISGNVVTSVPFQNLNRIPTIVTTPPSYNYLGYDSDLGSLSQNYKEPGWFKKFLEKRRKHQLLRNEAEGIEGVEGEEGEEEGSTPVVAITPVPVYINKRK